MLANHSGNGPLAVSLRHLQIQLLSLLGDVNPSICVWIVVDLCCQLGRELGASLMAHMVKIHLQCRRPGFHPWVERIPWRREWQPTPVFLPGEFHGQRSLAGCGPWGHEESDTTEQLTL